jgi:Ataxin-3
MVGVPALLDVIYHEKQEPGSMLCAQHALNSLLRKHRSCDNLLCDFDKKKTRLEDNYVCGSYPFAWALSR